MEALVAIFAEIIIACMMPVFALMGAVVSAIFEGILLLFGGVFAEYVEARRRRRAEAKDQPHVARKPLIPRKVIHWTAGICATMGALGVVASFVFFQPILRYVMDVAGEKAGMSIAYDTASGSLLGGNVALENIALSRAHDTGLAFDLEVANAEADVSLTSLVFGTPTLVLGRVEGMTGEITPPLPKEEKKGLPKPRRPFRAERFALQGVSLQITPRGEEPYSVVIDQAEVAPFRSGLAVFDLLFRSNMKAEIAGQSLIVETKRITDDGRETHWAFEEIDAAQLGRILPKAPLTWVSEGQITVDVSDKWSLSNDFVDMDWRIATSQMRTTVPQNANAGERILAAGLRKYVDRFGGDVNFQYRLELDPEDMAQLREGDLEAFWQKVLSGIVKGGVTKPDTKEAAEEALEEEAPGALDRLRSIFGRDADEN
ncbi:MAG: hypothetical protein AAF641_16970 [Pseudomonadota bacterium]